MPDRPACTVADLVIDALRRLGVDTLFCLPGVQNDDFFDRLVGARDIGLSSPATSRRGLHGGGSGAGDGAAVGLAVVPGPAS
jgi:hypothetical protein